MTNLLQSALHLYSLAIVVSVLLSWVGASSGNPLVRILRDMTEPFFQWIRRKMPFVVAAGLDFSPVVAILLVQMAGWLVTRVLGR